MDKKINIHIGSGFDPSGVTEARKTLSDFHKKLMVTTAWDVLTNVCESVGCTFEVVHGEVEIGE